MGLVPVCCVGDLHSCIGTATLMLRNQGAVARWEECQRMGKHHLMRRLCPEKELLVVNSV